MMHRPLSLRHRMLAGLVTGGVLLGACGSSSPHTEGGLAGASGGPGAASGASGATALPSAGSGGTVATGASGTSAGGGAPGAGSTGTQSAGAAGTPSTSQTFPQLAKLYQGVFSAPPKLTDTDQTTDAPLLGNGDLGVSMQGTIDALTFVLHKNEFWSLSQGHVAAMAKLAVTVPGLAGATYSVKEDIASAELQGSFVKGSQTLTTKSWVQADDTTHNHFVTQLSLTGTGSQDITVSLAAGPNGNPGPLGSASDVLYLDVRADGPDQVNGVPTHRVRIATRAVGATGTISNNQLKLTLSAGTTVSLVSSVMSFEDDAAYQKLATEAVSGLGASDVDAQLTRHHAWWAAFYAKSFVEIPNKLVEKEYYGSLYLLASTSRSGEAAPGLWGNWVIKTPAWNGDYTLNYNYEAPFYAAFPTNHVELADSYDEPVLDWLPKAQAEAKANGFTGAFYRVHIGPLPNGSSDTNLWNQKSCGAFAASDLLMHYYFTLDPTYAKKIYPVLQQLALFWQNYLTKDGDRYVIENDAQHEGNAYPQSNGIMSLGLVRFLLQGTIDISNALELDADQRAIWQERLSHLSAYPTFIKDGKTVFRYTEVGLDWNGGNAIGNQHIYPASQIGLGSEPALLQTAQNMIAAMARWNDGNGTDTFYPAAARVGSDPAALLTHLTQWIQNNTYPNLHIHTGGGGIENLNTVPSTVAEMLLQSFQGKLRLFADWPKGVDARFGDLRAYGAFLVSSDVRANAVQYVRLVSERGGPVVLVNPWASGALRLYRNGVDAGTLRGAELTLQTTTNEVIHLVPDGTTYAAVLERMQAPLAAAQ